MTSLSVIIPVYNDARRLRLCLDALAAQDYPRERFEVIVVDNGSDDSPQELVEGYSFCRFAEEPQPGSYAARNRGLLVASGELLAFTDSDCQPQTGWLSAGVQTLAEHSNRAVVGGAIEVFVAQQERPTSVELYDMAYGLRQENYVKLARYAATANMFTSRQVIDAVGGFNSKLLSSGDAEWGNRAAAAGFSLVYCPKAVVRHPARRSLAQIITKARRHAGGRADLHRHGSAKRSLWHRLRTACRHLLPDVSMIAEGSGRLSAQGYGFLARGRAAVVVLVVQYTKVFEYARVKLGGNAERS